MKDMKPFLIFNYQRESIYNIRMTIYLGYWSGYDFEWEDCFNTPEYLILLCFTEMFSLRNIYNN